MVRGTEGLNDSSKGLLSWFDRWKGILILVFELHDSRMRVSGDLFNKGKGRD